MLAASYGMFDQAGADQSKTHKPRTHAHSPKTPRAKNARGLPESYNYSDTGCELAPSCLECPLAKCKYDDPNGNRRNLMRDQEIVRLHAQGLKISQIAKIVNTSERTVYRITRPDTESKTDTPSKLNSSTRSDTTPENQIPVEQLAVWMQYSTGDIMDVRTG